MEKETRRIRLHDFVVHLEEAEIFLRILRDVDECVRFSFN